MAAVRRVPTDYATIQFAVDDALDGDTILVAVGTYAEAIISPAVSLAIIGEVEHDSSGVVRPIIDPSPLPNSQSLSCLHLAGPSARLENLVFRNGAEMYPHSPQYGGGVIFGGDDIVVRDCVLDSAAAGIVTPPSTDIELDGCTFVDCINANLVINFSTVAARNCNFNRRGVSCGPNSEFVDCKFDSIVIGNALLLQGQSRVENCLFRNFVSGGGMSAIESGNLYGEIIGCAFIGGQPGWRMLGFMRDCNEDLLIEGNTFHDIHSQTANGGAISWGCADGTSGGTIELRDNTFSLCYGDAGGKCIRYGNDSSQIVIERNRFIDNFGSGSAVSLSTLGQRLRDNVFINNGYALSSLYSCDARRNYWGDSTGPYNETYNPSGLGDRVSDSVIFDSWYPDTSFLIDAARERVPLPRDFAMSVFPNPFNSLATIALEIPDAFVGSVEVLNILGERIEEIHRGPLYGHHEFKLTANRLASGVYVVRVRDIVRHSVNFSQKILLIR